MAIDFTGISTEEIRNHKYYQLEVNELNRLIMELSDDLTMAKVCLGQKTGDLCMTGKYMLVWNEGEIPEIKRPDQFLTVVGYEGLQTVAVCNGHRYTKHRLLTKDELETLF